MEATTQDWTPASGLLAKTSPWNYIGAEAVFLVRKIGQEYPPKLEDSPPI